MDIGAVPQDGNSALGGYRKAVYAKDANGRMVLAQSTGWEVEEIVTMQVIRTLEAEAQAARRRVDAGLSSTLEYWMYACRMDALCLAQSTGIWQWRVRRHLKPRPFSRLSAAQIKIYADALGMSPEQLKSLPSPGLTSAT